VNRTGSGAGPRSRLRAEAGSASAAVPVVPKATVGSGASSASTALASSPDDGRRKDDRPSTAAPKSEPRVAKPKPRPLEVLDPDTSDESDGEELPPEYTVLDLTVPRTALVINVSHVLKRLNGCCSLNQLTKSLKTFKEKTGVTLEAFLRANPMTFKLEGRIVYLVERGEKWQPPEDSQRGKGKGKDHSKGTSKGHKGASEGRRREREWTDTDDKWWYSGWWSDWQQGGRRL